jgi:nitrate reductase assembly molybdenum cofactor insertion protein NarJ
MTAQTVAIEAAPPMSVGTALVTDGSLAPLVGTYRLIAEWLLYPEEVDRDTLAEEFVEAACADAALVHPDLPGRLRAFHAEFDSVDCEQYLELLELNPRCPLYLGSYQFQEPATCSSAGVSDRNQYMLEIANVFRHFGLEMNTDLPDFLPAVIEFLALTAGVTGENKALRERFIQRMVWDGVRLFAFKLQAENTHYIHLAEALTLCLQYEVGELPEPDPEPVSSQSTRGPEMPQVGGDGIQGTKSELIQIEGVAARE